MSYPEYAMEITFESFENESGPINLCSEARIKLSEAKDLHRKIKTAFQQLIQIDNKMKECRLRYTKAKRDGLSFALTSLKLNLTTVREVRSAFIKYVKFRSTDLDKALNDLVTLTGREWSIG